MVGNALVLAPYLERYPEQGGPMERVPLEKCPFTIGRSETADHTVYSSSVSKLHAEIVEIGGRHLVRDLQSTNGTFVNGDRIEERFLEEGDIIHVATVEFCFREQPAREVLIPDTRELTADQTLALPLGQPSSLIRGAALLRELINRESVTIVFEPIVHLDTMEVIGYEALGRGAHPELPRAPAALLSLADQCGMAIEVSQLFRRLSLIQSRRMPAGPKLFLNVHAREVDDPEFLRSLSALPRAAADSRTIVIEIPEASVTNAEVMANHRSAFADLGFELAYDDFGAGYARLIELTDVPPAYLKLDRSLIDGIEARARQDMVEALVGVAGSLGVVVIAEGIETEKVAMTCRRLGCRLGQGYLFSPPVPSRLPSGSTPRPAPRRGQPARRARRQR